MLPVYAACVYVCVCVRAWGGGINFVTVGTIYNITVYDVMYDVIGTM